MNAIDWMFDVPQCKSEREFLIDTITGEILTCGGLYAIKQVIKVEGLDCGIDQRLHVWAVA